MTGNSCFRSFCLASIITYSTNIFAEKVYSVGIVPQFDSRVTTEVWQPVLEEVTKLSGVQLKLQTSSSIPVFEKQLGSGDFDFAYVNPYHAIVANKESGYKPVLRDTGRSLYGILVVRKDSPIKSVEQLDGKVVAFPAPNALGAALIPRAEFANKFNIKVDEKYVKNHGSVYLNVILDKAAAGGGVQKTLSQQSEAIRNQLRVLHKTTEVSPHPIVVHPRVEKEVEDRVTAAFLEIGNSGSGRLMLKKIPMKKIGVATIDDYSPLKSMGLEAFYVSK